MTLPPNATPLRRRPEGRSLVLWLGLIVLAGLGIAIDSRAIGLCTAIGLLGVTGASLWIRRLVLAIQEEQALSELHSRRQVLRLVRQLRDERRRRARSARAAERERAQRLLVQSRTSAAGLRQDLEAHAQSVRRESQRRIERAAAASRRLPLNELARSLEAALVQRGYYSVGLTEDDNGVRLVMAGAAGAQLLARCIGRVARRSDLAALRAEATQISAQQVLLVSMKGFSPGLAREAGYQPVTLVDSYLLAQWQQPLPESPAQQAREDGELNA
ncbi:MAG TPA: hypothetical protein VGS41_04980 [Chthonomonadales bacterium]|nr:hypothetical protein [Chthonomonadales bacterium]